MTAYRHRRLLLVGLWLLALASPMGAAQQGSEGGPSPVTADLLEAKISETESAADLADETKTRLLSLYRQALSNLQEAASHRESATGFQEALQTASIEARAIREDMDESNVAEPAEILAVDASTSLRALEAYAQRDRGDFVLTDKLRADLSKRLDEEAARPAAIRLRLLAAAEEQDEILAQRQLTAPSEDGSAEAQASRWVLETRGEALSAEIEMLDQELLSHPGRIELLEAKRDKATADAGSINRRIALLEDLITTRRQADA